ncbi:MAG TPA: chromosome segregation protein SMC [Burkholderiaceae bacterium]|nr:chromosome segregation protein SMC [Burkholderiaceae bacterium]
MRLRQIKLAGFKSFIDPTPIDVPGSLVGVVGPNGCGKSNVIDAVRWVLGESKAAELRGESMQDVIFNGSVNRKPGGRASVELVFDNADGRIGGAWGQYAEISVKRVLTRDGTSSYYINNQTVRRRDVHDMFLGTGLGPRAYAIIGQGMISRIVEARPEELRIFLEEAAGISKYKERRRETENRLADTRDNLTRVEDILRELDGQIVRLEQQAEVAARYREMQTSHDQQQQMLWLLRRREAEADREKVARDIESRTTALEGHVAELRGAERALEEVRTAHYAASDSVHEAQGALLQVNAEVSRLESEIRMIVDGRTRLQSQIETLKATRARRMDERSELLARAASLVQAIEDATAKLAQSQSDCAGHEGTLPALEQGYQAAREAMTAARAQAAISEQAIDAAGVEQRNIDKQLGVLLLRRERLAEERASIGSPDEARLATLQQEVAGLESQLGEHAASQSAAEARVNAATAERQQQFDQRAAAQENLTRIEARLAALRQVQANVEANTRLDPWLAAQGLDSLPRLFRRLSVEHGWETAFEAVLRERVESVEVGRLDTVGGLASSAPPARVAFYSTTGAVAREGGQMPGFGRLSDRMRGHDAALSAVLTDWLANIFVAPDLAAALAAREQLPVGGQFIVRDGHIVSRYGVRFFAADDEKSGLLARRLEIENLDKEIRAQRLIVEERTAALARAESTLRDAQDQLVAGRREGERVRARLHEGQLEAVRLGELIDRVKHRSGQIESELAEIEAHEKDLRSGRDDADNRFQALDAELAARQEAVEGARVAYEQADQALRTARDEQRALESARQQVEFALASNRERERDVRHAADVAAADAERLEADIAASTSELGRLDDGAARAGLEDWLGRRAAAEDGLRQARSRLDELAQQLRSTDERRLTLERELEPRRQKITELQLKEQAARLAAEQFASQLAEVRADEAQLAEKLTAGTKPNALQAEIARLAEEIAALGAVNLAALEELTTSRERKAFLDAQSADLKAAITTLEDAIRKIDRETRELLQQTFDQVNAQFGQLFPKLFGGGEAKLIMTGEEILDAGVQVMAQPPGKRNSTIHLLSGGEKALTATALVFALFKLNPAPFCLLDEVDAPLDDANTERFCRLVESMTDNTQFLFITHNKIAMEMAQQLIGVTMQEQGVSRIVAVDIEGAVRLTAEAA